MTRKKITKREHDNFIAEVKFIKIIIINTILVQKSLFYSINILPREFRQGSLRSMDLQQEQRLVIETSKEQNNCLILHKNFDLSKLLILKFQKEVCSHFKMGPYLYGSL